ncbi:MAG: hypothetical protein C0514_07045 [Candidatus Puniceispirillum sp.]|nr:hypothetical protein [Candidatus Puniceispirillum sp.]
MPTHTDSPMYFISKIALHAKGAHFVLSYVKVSPFTRYHRWAHVSIWVYSTLLVGAHRGGKFEFLGGDLKKPVTMVNLYDLFTLFGTSD